MTDVDRIGGVPVVMRELLDAGLLHGDCLTVTGRTVAENLAALDPPAPDGDVVHPLSDPIHAAGRHRRAHRVAGPEGRGGQGGRASTRRFEGTARVFDGEDRRHGGHPGRADRARHRRRHPLRGPQGRPGHARDAGRHRGHEGRGPGRRLRPGHRRPVLGRHPRVLHRPRRPRGGRRRADRLRGRRRPHRDRRGRPHHRPAWSTTPSWPGGGPSWKLPEPRYTTGVLAKYARLVTGAERGAVTEA